MQKRIFYSDNGTLSDLSVNLNNYHSGTSAFTLVSAEDAIYIGSRLPFNHIYFKFDGSNVNANSSTMSVAIWDGGNWRDCVDVIDETDSSGVSFSQSGFVTWIPDKSYPWTRESTNYGNESITGLTSVEVYDLYWNRISFSADLTASTTLSWIGQKFSSDDDLGSEYPDLSRSGVKTAYESGKSDWEEQHIRAADLIIKDLLKLGLIAERDQVLDSEDLRLASVSRVAHLIYTAFGPDYEPRRIEAMNNYRERIANAFPRIDQNANARDDRNERVQFGRAIR